MGLWGILCGQFLVFFTLHQAEGELITLQNEACYFTSVSLFSVHVDIVYILPISLWYLDSLHELICSFLGVLIGKNLIQ